MATHHIYPMRGPDGASPDRRIGLQWQRGAYVQIATCRWAGEGAPDPGQEFRPGDDGPRPAWPGEFVDLSRDQINHLIKQLRVARDQAFGRDE